MTPEQATAEVDVLANLFPKTNDTQLNFFRRMFAGYDAAIVRTCVLKYADEHSDFVDRTELRAMIENKTRALLPAAVSPREAAERDAAIDRRRKELEAQRAADKSFDAINEILARLDDAALEALKARVVDAQLVLSPPLGAMLQRRDAKSSPLLRSLMATMLEGSGDV